MRAPGAGQGGGQEFVVREIQVMVKSRNGCNSTVRTVQMPGLKDPAIVRWFGDVWVVCPLSLSPEQRQ